MEDAFHGAKAAVFVGERLLIYQRDDTPGLPERGKWDFPGGGREGTETPLECLRREVLEEFGLDITEGDIVLQRAVRSVRGSINTAWFFVVRFDDAHKAHIHFGDEGQRWALQTVEHVVNMPDFSATMQARLKLWLRETGGVLI